MLTGKIYLYINGFRSLTGVDIAKEFYQLFLEAHKDLIPQKFTFASSPQKSDFNENNMKEIWIEAEKSFKKHIGESNGGVVECKGKNSLRYSIGWKPDGYNSISLTITEKTFKLVKVESYIEFIKKLFLAINGFYGYCQHSSQLSVHSTPGLNYETCIGGITWMALFGPPYVEMFEKETLKLAPCWVQEFAEDRFMLLTSVEPVEPTPEILEKQELVKKHLGEDAFFRHDEEAKRPKIYTMEEIAANKHLPNTEGYRHPDFSKFYKTKNGEVINFNEYVEQKNKL